MKTQTNLSQKTCSWRIGLLRTGPNQAVYRWEFEKNQDWWRKGQEGFGVWKPNSYGVVKAGR